MKAIKSFLSIYNNFDNEYVIRFGQARVIHKLSDSTVDYDIYVPPNIFNKYFKHDCLVEDVSACGGFPATSKVKYNHFGETFEVFKDYNFNSIDIVEKNGLRYVTKDQLLLDYKRLNRKKDLKWLLQKFIK